MNIDHAATLRQARYRGYETSCGKMVEPDPVAVAFAAEQAGADGITVHLREDRRHIQERDVLRLRESIQTRMNLEMAPTPAMVEFALKTKPVPFASFPSGAKKFRRKAAWMSPRALRNCGKLRRVLPKRELLRVFYRSDSKQIDAAAAIGAPCIELHTGAYANAYYDTAARSREFRRLCHAAENAANVAITTNAGHGINYVNITEVVEIPHLHELNIGHSILCRSILTGIGEAVREMKARMRDGITILPRP